MKLFALGPLLAGCTQILGLDNTVLDAQPIDAPSVCDGAPACTSVNGRSVCGQLFATGTNAGQPLRVASVTGERCATGNTEGPCALTVSGYSLASYLDGTRMPKIDGLVDDCGRYVVGDLDAGTADVAIEFTGNGFQTFATLLLGRTSGIGEDRDIAAFAPDSATVAAWSTQVSSGMAVETTTGFLISYTDAAHKPLAGEQVAINGQSAFGNPIGTVPWAGYFSGSQPFGAIDPAQPSTGATGTAFAVLSSGMFSLEGFRMGNRCKIGDLTQIANTLIHVIGLDC